MLEKNTDIIQKRIRRQRTSEKLIEKFLLFCSLISIFTTMGIIFVLIFETFGFFKVVSIKEFFTGTKWTPLFQPKHFGILPLLFGTFVTTAGASIIALPVGLGSAIYLSEYASEKVRKIIKPILEILAGIPTIVYGYFALTFVTPIIRYFVPETGIFNAVSASIVMGIMIIPMVSSLSEDAMVAVPQSIREGAYALGATRYEVALKAVVPSALSGIISSFVLAISRAIGETMIVVIAAGSTPKLTFDVFDSIQTMTAYIVQVSLGDTPHGSIEYQTIFAVGMTLFMITLAMNILAQYITNKYKRSY